MKKISLILLAAICSVSLSAQDFNFDAYLYDLDKSAVQSPLMDSTGFNSCLHWSRLYEEYAADPYLGLKKIRLSHTLRQINNIAAVEQYNKLAFPIGRYQNLVNFKLRVIKNGEVVHSADKSSFKIVEEEGSKYWLLAVENVSEGCYIETVLAFTDDLELTGTEYMQSNVPVRESMICLISPEKVHFSAKIYNSDLSLKDSLAYERRFLFGKINNLRGNKAVPYCLTDKYDVRMEYRLQEVEGGNYKPEKWADIATKYFDNVFANFEDSESGIKKVVSQLKLEKMENVADKIFTIENFIKTNIQQVDNVNTPDKAAEVVKVKYGNWYAINRLYMFLFRMSGINFELYGTCKRENKSFDPDFESSNYFTNILFYFPDTKAFMDPAAQTVRTPIIDDQFLGQDAMRVKLTDIGGELRPVTTIKRIEVNKPEESTIREIYDITFNTNMDATTQTYYKSYGGFAHYGLKAAAYYLSEEDKEKTFKDMIRGDLESSTVSDLSFENADLALRAQAEAPLVVKARIVGPDLLEYAGEKIIFKLGQTIGTQAELYHEEERNNPVDIEFLHYYERTITVNKPAGMKFTGLETINRDFQCLNPDGSSAALFRSSYKMEGDKLVVTISEHYTSLNLPVESYDSFSKVINAAADFNKVTILLEAEK